MCEMRREGILTVPCLVTFALTPTSHLPLFAGWWLPNGIDHKEEEMLEEVKTTPRDWVTHWLFSDPSSYMYIYSQQMWIRRFPGTSL